MSNDQNNQFIRQTLELIRNDIERTVRQLRVQVNGLEGELGRTREERDRFVKANAKLEEENIRLRARIEELEAKQPLLDAQTLLISFGDALQAMQRALEETAGPVRYALRDLNTDLRVGMVVDEEGTVRFRLPGLTEVVAPENLSTLNFSLVATAPAAEELDVVRVPRVVGLALDRARDRVERAQLTLGKIEERISAQPPGIVLEQYPPGGAVAKIGRAVDMVVAKKETTRVPLLINLLQEEAADLLKQVRLRLGNVTTAPSDAPEGTVIQQSIEAKTEVPVNTEVDLVVSEGKRVMVPDVRGLNQRETRKRLRAAGLQLGRVNWSPSEIEKGLVIEQKPDAGTEVALGAKVDVTLSEGRKEQGVAVPDVVGQTLEEATKLLTAQGWRIQPHVASEEDIAAFPKARSGQVLRQDPAAGMRADKATALVHFWVALSTLPVTEIDGIGDKRRARLAEIGITTVGEFCLARAAQIASALGVSESHAQGFIDMATFMSHLTVVSLRDEVVEVLVKGAKVRSMEDLATADPTQLYRTSLEAVEGGRVRVPKGFFFTIEDVQGWIMAAQNYLKEKGANRTRNS